MGELYDVRDPELNDLLTLTSQNEGNAAECYFASGERIMIEVSSPFDLTLSDSSRNTHGSDS